MKNLVIGTTIPVMNLEDKFAFGPYKGVKLATVIKSDPKHVQDCIDTMKNFVISQDAKILLINTKQSVKYKEVKCRKCKGDGEVEDNGPKACPSCGGNGYITEILANEKKANKK